ncbi:hypothetical protein BATDEDRAFT_91237 [Batrachochytrium dendrobatidis JAM81]|uniref:Uncharacterized protein n=1 Tax=Batrachochytrium dendrobatidis (strain JAM81 / FGSC 10211) TaxID=684364 RepID=F4P9M9_BATDJ|nr:uncharacterized protein BATDEDRAFT_91237 [Batrachochytrium dendrobatidis JAM81]EGF77947.1 hypothetical protein BATDEDRAFT_91237 [Batrachochytrium dendrobatidis JAM81]KAK5670288.1 hypothetical protein QVD99_002987 [Batrachochytrium dendrobatidis]|eukprot:XP_006681523.1 hypothetical protein BATDEDRAFT_91237 [Batrachochytrium dendrobatidis JAM81]
MKLVDILFVLTAAATANAILIPTDNDGLPQASSTSSQVSVSTSEPNPGTSNEYQEEPVDLSLSNRIRQRPMDQPGLNTLTQSQRPTVIVAGPNILKQGRKRIMDVIDLTTSDQDQQQPTDVAGPSTSKQSRKRPINEISPSISSQASGSTNEPGPSAPKQSRKQPIDQPIPSTSSQDQQQPIGQGESANTVTNQIAGLSQKFQRTFNRIKQGLVESKELRKKKLKEYCDYEVLRFEQWSALERGEEISGSEYNPDTEKRLKQEYRDAGARVWELRHQLKKFMKRRGLRFEEPDSD